MKCRLYFPLRQTGAALTMYSDAAPTCDEADDGIGWGGLATFCQCREQLVDTDDEYAAVWLWEGFSGSQ